MITKKDLRELIALCESQEYCTVECPMHNNHIGYCMLDSIPRYWVSTDIDDLRLEEK